MSNFNYLLATIKPWNIKIFNEKIKEFPGNWHIITNPGLLTIEYVKELAPKYIFFPHWSELVSEDITSSAECVCFHMTDLPFGRGGSPLQNLIKLGMKETIITALKMTPNLDAGPVYLKKTLSLHGLAEEIYIRAANTISEMILKIVDNDCEASPQTGKASFFKRRKPEQSQINSDLRTLDQLFDHIRMLDAEGYPKAYIDFENFRFEFSRPALKTENILADVKIIKREKINDV